MGTRTSLPHNCTPVSLPRPQVTAKTLLPSSNWTAHHSPRTAWHGNPAQLPGNQGFLRLKANESGCSKGKKTRTPFCLHNRTIKFQRRLADSLSSKFSFCKHFVALLCAKLITSTLWVSSLKKEQHSVNGDNHREAVRSHCHRTAAWVPGGDVLAERPRECSHLLLLWHVLQQRLQGDRWGTGQLRARTTTANHSADLRTPVLH